MAGVRPRVTADQVGAFAPAIESVHTGHAERRECARGPTSGVADWPLCAVDVRLGAQELNCSVVGFAQALGDLDRGCVLRPDQADHLVGMQHVEGVVNRGASGFSGIPVSPSVSVQSPSDLQTRPALRSPQTCTANEHTGRALLQRPLSDQPVRHQSQLRQPHRHQLLLHRAGQRGRRHRQLLTSTSTSPRTGPHRPDVNGPDQKAPTECKAVAGAVRSGVSVGGFRAGGRSG
jgi:hypothetical protein